MNFEASHFSITIQRKNEFYLCRYGVHDIKNKQKNFKAKEINKMAKHSFGKYVCYNYCFALLLFYAVCNLYTNAYMTLG